MRVCYSDGRPSKWIDEDNMAGKLTFTDDDLQKLKGFISIDDFYKPIGGHYMRPLVKALIARLEAAEDCVDHSAGRETHHGDCTNHPVSCRRCFYEKWREVAGFACRKAAGK
jgi:hypothetical protein